MQKIASLAIIAGSLICAAVVGGQSPSTEGTPPAVGTPIFNYGGDAAQIPAQFADHLVFLSPRVNQSSPSLFELDTTAAETSIDTGRASEIGRSGAASPVLSFEGMDFPLASLKELSNAVFTARTGLDYQGTLGRDFLANLVLQIDYARETVRAYAPASYKYTGKGIVLPLADTNGAPVVSVRFALEHSREIQANFIIDTTLDAPVVLSNKFLASHHMNGDRGKTLPAIDSISGGPGASLGHLRTFQIVRQYVNDVLAIYSDQPITDATPQTAGAIGSGLLRRFTVVFDFPHRQLILEPNMQFTDPDQEDKSGLLVVAKAANHRTFEVAAVQSNSPAAAAGLRKGDIIAGIDTDPAADLSLLTIRNLFMQVGHKYKVTYQRGDDTKDATLQMHRYF